MTQQLMISFCKTIAAFCLGLTLTVVRAEDAPELTLHAAHEMALKNHPQIKLANLRALAAKQVTRQVRSAYFPNLSANVTSVGTTEDNTRLAALGGLNNPAIFDRNAEGIVLSQLITDFGRTANLTGSARFKAMAEENNAQATREQILLAVDGASYAAQQAEAVTRVAEKTVSARQLFLEQVTALATNKLRSELDVSFARVNVEETKLLLSRAQNDLQAAFTQLSTLMGSSESKIYHLPEQAIPAEVSTNAFTFIQDALANRPDLQRLRNERSGASRFASAEKAARYPVISAVGAAGISPIHDTQIPDHYAAAGVVLSMPLFAGGYYSARQHEAELRADAALEAVRDAENNVIRDVRIAWLNTQNAFERLRITEQLLANARQSYTLAEASYSAGISSIVEFNQAEVSLISAQIAYANTQYEYLLQQSALKFQTGTLR